jgi:hypothetical protein
MKMFLISLKLKTTTAHAHTTKQHIQANFAKGCSPYMLPKTDGCSTRSWGVELPPLLAKNSILIALEAKYPQINASGLMNVYQHCN